MKRTASGFDTPAVRFFFTTYILVFVFGATYVFAGPFRKIPGLDLQASLELLWWLVAILGTGGTILRAACRGRPLGGCVPNVMFPFGVYTVLAYRTICPALLTALSLLAGALCVVYTVLILRKKSRRSGTRITAGKLRRICVGVQSTVAFFGAVAMMVCFLGSSRVSYSMTNSDVAPIASTQTDDADDLLHTYQKDIKRLHPDIWTTLSVEDRGELLQMVANVEAARLGLPHELKVVLRDQSEGTLASYRDSEHLIVISTSVVETEPVEDVIQSVCHEAEHAYQHRLVDLYEGAEAPELLILQDARTYAREFKIYTNGDDPNSTFEAYYSQQVEEDARAAGRQGVERWKAWIGQCKDGAWQVGNPRHSERT